MTKALLRRLEKLETRARIVSSPLSFEIRFIDEQGRVASTFLLQEGQQVRQADAEQGSDDNDQRESSVGEPP